MVTIILRPAIESDDGDHLDGQIDFGPSRTPSSLSERQEIERGLSGYGGNSQIVSVFIREYQPDPHNPRSIVSLSDKLRVRAIVDHTTDPT